MGMMNITIGLPRGGHLSAWTDERSIRTSWFRVWCRINCGGVYYRVWRWKWDNQYWIKYPGVEKYTDIVIEKTVTTKTLNKIKDKKNML